MKLEAPNHLPIFYKCILKHWSEIKTEPIIPSVIQNQVIFDNCYIQVNRKPIKRWSTTKLFVGDFFEQDGSFKSWENFNRIHDLGSEKMFKWRQARHAIPESWKRIIRTNLETFNLSNGNMRTQHALYNASDYILEKCTSKMFYGKLIKNKIEKPTAQKKNRRKIAWSNFRLGKNLLIRKANNSR
jgi:hypothetical protein